MTDEELRWLADRAAEHTTIVEVGCWMGRTTCALAENSHGTVYAVDTWLGSAEIEHLTREHPPEWLYNEFIRCVGDLVASGKIVVQQGPSVEVAQRIAIRPDMIFIDAAHDLDNVVADIITWSRLLVAGGLLCGHDFDNQHQAVARAVKRLCPTFERGPGSIWYVP